MKLVLRNIIGFLISPWFGLLGGAVLYCLLFEPGGFTWQGAYMGIPMTALLTSFVFILLAYPGALILGLPLLFVLHKAKMNKWWHYCIAGALCGMLIQLVFINAIQIRSAIGSGSKIKFVIYNDFWLAAFSGAVGFFIFWIIAVRGKFKKNVPEVLFTVK